MSPTLFPRLPLLALLAGCGTKPDGTPYGVNPNKLPEGRSKVSADSERYDHYKKGMPKGAKSTPLATAARRARSTTTAPGNNFGPERA